MQKYRTMKHIAAEHKKNEVITRLLPGFNLCSILFLLFWGVENVWASCTGDIGHNIAFNDCHFYFNPYYNESNTVNQGYIQLAARKYQYHDCDTWGWYTGVTTLNNVTNTRLYYASSLEGTAWGDSYKKFDGWAMISNSDDKKNGDTEYWKSGNSTWYSEYKNYGLNSDKTYLFQASSSSNGQTIETTSASGYLEDGWSALNKTITVKAKISIDNGGNYSEATSPGVLTASSYKFTAHNTCTTSTSLSSVDITCGYTATTTLTAPSTDPTGYTWVGWYDASGTRKTTSKTLTIYPTEDATYYAYYKANQYTGTIDKNNGAADKSYTATYNVGTLTIATAPSRTGYSLSGYYEEDACTHLIANAFKTLQNSTTYTNSSGKWTYTSAPKIYAGWTANTYDVILDVNGGSGSNQTVTATYDAAMPTTLKGGSDPIETRTRTGYTFGGYWANNDGTGTQYYTTGLANNHNWDIATNEQHIYAKWTAKNYTVTLDVDEANKGNIDGATTSQSVSYDAATTTVPNRPTAAQGYALTGYFTSSGGEGTKVINGDGTWIASVDGYTDASKHWVHDGDVTLYAYYEKAQVTALTFDATIVAPNGSVGVTPTISPTPTGTTGICWRVLHSNGNPLASQPTFSSNPSSGSTKVTFNASSTSGTYLIEARLRKGSDCNGEVLDSVTAPFQVAGDHTVTVQYKCGDDFIQASSSVTGKPLAWTEITAPDIDGYLFSKWKAGDGITIDGADGSGEKASATIQFTATYEGKLTAIYTKIDYIYFKNTMGWSNVYVHFYTSDKYWDETYYGSGSQKEKEFDGKKPYYDEKHGQLTQITGTDIWRFDCGAIGCADWTNIVFNANEQNNYEWFYTTELVRRGDFKKGTPLYVPADKNSYNPILKNTDAKYYNKGYWVNYLGPRTGYTLEIYKSDGSSLVKSIAFPSDDKLMPMAVTVDLEASHTYKFQLKRDGNTDGDVLYGNTGSMNYSDHGQGSPWKFTAGTDKCTIVTTAAGDYTFHLTYAKTNSDEYHLRISVDFPIKNGDYRLIYKDDVHTAFHPSGIVPVVNSSKDTVSFFVRGQCHPVLRIQKATVAGDGTTTWAEYPTPGTPTNQITGSIASAITTTQDSIYNFCLAMDGSGNLSVTKAEAYTGNFYIRTDGANSKWDNYTTDPDHLITYSGYAESNSDYTHYYMKFVRSGTNVKFVIANDYSPCISDTLIQQTYRGGDASHVDENGFIEADANIRFMWNIHTNAVIRAYLAAAQDDGSKFLVLRGQNDDNITDEDGNNLRDESGNNHGGGDHCMQFTDKENWIYEASIKIEPSSFVKIYAYFNESYFYYKGANNDTFNGSDSGDEYHTPNAIQLLTGEGSAQKVRVIYDFKTDRLISALLPSGNISTPTAINADVMFVRDHQGDINQLTFSNGGSGMGNLSSINTAYGIMQFNKYTLNNKSREGGHSPVATPASIYERCLYWISFPFDVKLSEVFGFGTYGTHWIVQYYDGAERAEKGYWAESGSFWKPIWDRSTYVLHANQGYLLTLAVDEDLFTADKIDIWGPDSKSDQIELYFPSYGTMPTITNSTVMHNLPAHTCSINRAETEGLPDTGDPATTYNRTIVDSHWNVMSVPTYVNTSSITYANITWTAAHPNFIYTWNADDNTLTATSSSGYTFHAMHAYMVQYSGNVTWTSSVSKSSIVARRTYEEVPSEVEFDIELQQNGQMVDRTFVRLSDDDDVSADFVFGEDMSKNFNANKANIYTKIDYLAAAGNTLPMTDQTTIVPLGVKTASAGSYTISIPQGTNGIGVTLIDEQTGDRTDLGLVDYTVELEEGSYPNRFLLEISAVKTTPTGIENADVRNQNSDARKVLIDGMLYIVKDGKIYDATGSLIK